MSGVRRKTLRDVHKADKEASLDLTGLERLVNKNKRRHEMKRLIMILTAGMVAACFGQGVLRRPVARPFLGLEAEFLEKHPSGTNEFGRTYSQQSEYENGFELKSFLGYEFGQSYTNARSGGWVKVVLPKPFRAFTEGMLVHGEFGWLYEVRLSTNLVDVTRESLSNEVDRIAVLLEKAYGIVMLSRRGSVNNRYFSSPNTHFSVSFDYNGRDGSGELSMTVTNRRIARLGVKRAEEERERRLREKSKKFEVAEDEGADLLSSTEIIKPSAVAEDSSRSSGGGLPGSRLVYQTGMRSPAAREAMIKSRVERAKTRVEQLNSVKDKVAQLSDDARALYEEDVRRASSELIAMTNELKKIEDVLTPEIRAQYEKEQKEKRERQKRKEKAEEEYFEMMKSSGATQLHFFPMEMIMRSRAEKDAEEAARSEQRQQLLSIQEELRRVREAKAAEEAARSGVNGV